jgi:hypothetical protein
MMAIIDVQQPAPYDIVGPDLLVAGQSLTFEGTVQWSLSEGHDELDGFITNSGTGVTQFQFTISGIEASAMKLPRLFLTVREDDVSDGEGPPPPSVTIPVLYGPLLVDNFEGWQPYKIQAGDTLSAIAANYYGQPTAYPILAAANPLTIADPDVIFAGQVIRVPIGTPKSAP